MSEIIGIYFVFSGYNIMDFHNEKKNKQKPNVDVMLPVAPMELENTF